MITEIKKIDKKSLEQAKKIIDDGGLVAFPTETVYGLGALATNDEAVKGIYAAKGRPSDNPLIVHVHKDYDITSLVDIDSDYAVKIANAFLPAPLTMVYKSKGVVSPTVSCGLNTLAIRVPQSPAAQEFLRFVNAPIAAPSANISKHTSPVTAEHVFEDFNGKIPLILDGGRCEGGIESTVLDVTGDIPVILRKGLITAEMIKKAVGECRYADEKVEGVAKSPGMKYSHYRPHAKTLLFGRYETEKAVNAYNEALKNGLKPVFLLDGEMRLKLEKLGSFNVLNFGDTDVERAANLYEMLHEGENYDLIISFALDIKSELDLSVNNRFSKAFYSVDEKR
ncbi:MAG: L-threonylcarbamoyladenylate synthase [Candidatus Borkfalkiaceae bacterium]|nr:L-threonylcarbamoyladenylate synthase [Christensenellaceae bacterium]